MKKFMDEDFLLKTETAKTLYHQHAAKMPIIDYHCHLKPEEIAGDRRFENIAQVWLGGDHYKWRTMRAMGVEEELITGSGTDYDKFLAWTKTVPYLIGNPLFHWTYLELKRFFGIEKTICPENAKYIWDAANEKIASPEFSARGLIRQSRVEVICTTDDPVDSLEHHEAVAQSGFETKVLPTFRPDKAVNIANDTFLPYLAQLEAVTGRQADSIDALKGMLKERLDHFEKHGCRISDHALDTVPFAPASEEEVNAVFLKRKAGGLLTEQESDQYKTGLLLFLGEEYARRGWVMQLHMSAMRNNNARMYAKLGPDTGYDSINDGRIAMPLAGFLNALAERDALPKTVLYSLNPTDNAVLATMTGNFQTAGVRGKMQWGAPWWFNDHKDGMEEHLRMLANEGVLPVFIGMLTDSRSFLSYPRHEYFRRILCNVLANWIETGEYPQDEALVGKIVEDIAYNNVKTYLQV